VEHLLLHSKHPKGPIPLDHIVDHVPAHTGEPPIPAENPRPTPSTETSLLYLKLHPDAHLLTRGTPDSASLDLYAAEGCSIELGAQGQVKTGVALALPARTYGRIALRSGLA
jgi:dUTP pyrophosphatase